MVGGGITCTGIASGPDPRTASKSMFTDRPAAWSTALNRFHVSRMIPNQLGLGVAPLNAILTVTEIADVVRWYE